MVTESQNNLKPGFTLELIEWYDAGGEAIGWLPANDVDGDDTPLVTSVGWVVKETDRNVTLAMDLCEDGETNTRGRIPKGMIRNRTKISINT